MKKLLASVRVSLFPPEHGGAKNIRQIVSSLSRRGVECRVLIKSHPPSPTKLRFAGQRPEGMDEYGPEIEFRDELRHSFIHEGISYRIIHGTSDDLACASAEELKSFNPDVFLLCDDALDDGKSLFEVGAQSGKLIFLAQTIHCQPFGPYAMKPSSEITDSIRQAKRIIAPSQFVATYIEKHVGRSAEVWYPDVFGDAPFSKLGHFSNAFITMVNPCPWKGSSIFIALARRRPEWSFAAVPTWGATDDLLASLGELPNVTLLKESRSIEPILSQTRVLLAPSLCQEAFGLVSPEAMLRGIPVVASDIAGLKESTLGVSPLITVRPLPFDKPPQGTDHTQFVWEEPENSVEPWSRAISKIIESEATYETFSKTVKSAAENFVGALAGRDVLAAFSI
jgi:glycosyltransferase involved in cell wall biosynthesis